MSRTPSSRRKSASGPKSIDPSPTRTRELNTKRRGELAELAFTLKAASLGFGVSKPYGDSERYDVIVDPRAIMIEYSLEDCHPERSTPKSEANRIAQSKDPASAGSRQKQREEFPPTPGERSPETAATPATLHRVQIKASTQLFQGLYRVNAHRRTNGRAVPYRPSEIDFIAACIIPENTWYIIPIHAVRGTSLMFRRKSDPKPGLYDQFREAWHLLRYR
jgi:hypothetical protein